LDVLDRIVAERPWEGAQWIHSVRNSILQRELSTFAAAPTAAKLAEQGRAA
jgi:hypothetical protein